MSEPTPGPWTAGYYKGRPAVYSETAFPGNGTAVVAICWEDDPAEDDAPDACLVAASPDLLAACKLAREEMVESGNWYARDQGWTKASRAVDDAIAKATGEPA